MCVKTDLFIEIKPERLKKQQKTNSQKKKLIAKKHSTKAQVKHKKIWISVIIIFLYLNKYKNYNVINVKALQVINYSSCEGEQVPICL